MAHPSWVKRLGIVAPALAELLTEIRRPVLGTHLPTIEVDGGESPAGLERTALFDHPVDNFF
jgi:hypothetical protein